MRFEAAIGRSEAGSVRVDFRNLTGGGTGEQLRSVRELGARIYDKQCASCHGEHGEGISRTYPRLAGEPATATSNAIRIVLNGGFAPATERNARPYSMPPFGSTLSDAEVAAVLSFIRSRWGNQHQLVAAHEVARYRGGE